MRPLGWRYESARHALAARGVSTGRRYNLIYPKEEYIRKKGLEPVAWGFKGRLPAEKKIAFVPGTFIGEKILQPSENAEAEFLKYLKTARPDIFKRFMRGALLDGKISAEEYEVETGDVTARIEGKEGIAKLIRQEEFESKQLGILSDAEELEQERKRLMIMTNPWLLEDPDFKKEAYELGKELTLKEKIQKELKRKSPKYIEGVEKELKEEQEAIKKYNEMIKKNVEKKKEEEEKAKTEIYKQEAAKELIEKGIERALQKNLKEFFARKRKDLIKGGIGDKKSINVFDKEWLKKGTKVEMEHTNNPKIAREIAIDHMTEFGSDYYKELAKMEARLEKRRRVHAQ